MGGVLISTLVPQHSSTLAAAVVILLMGGAISEPQSIAEAAPGTLSSLLAQLSPFTWSSGENYLVFVASQEGGVRSVSPAALPIYNGYQQLLRSGKLKDLNMGPVLSAYVSCMVLGLMSLLFGYLGLRLSHRGKQA